MRKNHYLRNIQLKRRKWLNTGTGKIVSRDWDVVAEGTKMAQEFAFFLKAYLDSTPISCKTLRQAPCENSDSLHDDIDNKKASFGALILIFV